MQYILTKSIWVRRCAWLVALCVCLGGVSALADYNMPVMPAPTDSPVYWRLTSIEETPEVSTAGGYTIQYDIAGLDLDLGDGLLTESLLQGDDAAQSMTLITDRNDQTVMEHSYIWTPLPIYLEPGVTYTIDVSGVNTVGSGTTPNSLLGIYVQGEIVARISAGGYTSHPSSASFDISADAGVYRDGSLVVSIILRDVNDMFRDRIAYTYTMEQGVKPVPTPVPGFAPVEMAAGVKVPEYYVPVEGKDGLWQIVTEPEQYRAYGSMSGSAPTFFPADADGNVPMDETPADLDSDFDDYVKGFVFADLDKAPAPYVPEGEGKYSFTTRDGETVERAYGRIDGKKPAFYPVDKDGNIDAKEAAAVTPESDFAEYVEGFGAAEPEEKIAYYREEGPGLYSFMGRDGEKRTRAYGRLDGAEPAYYEVDAEGEVKQGAKPVAPQDDFEAFIKGFDLTEPTEVPDYYEAVSEGLYVVESSDGDRHYRVYGVKDGNPPAFYPADEEGNIAESAEPLEADEDFLSFVAGFEVTDPAEIPDFYTETETEGVWSFVDKDGNTQYRAHGILNRGETAFYPSSETGEVAGDALRVEPASDLMLLPAPPFTPVEPEQVPPHYIPVEGTGHYSFVDLASNTHYRVYGSYGDAAPQFYPADEEGNPIENEGPIDPEADYQEYFGAFVPEAAAEAPDHYKAIDGKVGLYSYENSAHQKVYRIYGNVNGEAAFYPADEQGRIISGIVIDPENDRLDIATPLTKAVVTQAPPEATATALVRVVNTGDNALPMASPTELISEIAAASTPAGEKPAVTSVVATPEAKATEAATEAATEQETATPEPGTEEAGDTATEEPAQEEKSSFPWTIVIIAGVVVIIVAGVIIATRKKKK